MPQTHKNKSPELKVNSSEAIKAGERVQKVLARGGLGSRREVERWIKEGLIAINHVKATLGQSLTEGDVLHIKGRIVHWEKFAQQPTRVLVYHKPTGEVVTRRDPEGRPVIFTQLPKLQMGRWIAVGRLDINTSGLILVTNNGELANRLMHPSTEIEREYAVRILGNVNDEMMNRLKLGVELEDGEAHFEDIKFFAGEGANKWYHVVVKEGRNRLVRRLWESQDVTVSRLMRVRYGPAILPERVRAHSHYELNAKELAVLMEFVAMEPEKQQRPQWQPKSQRVPVKDRSEPSSKHSKKQTGKQIGKQTGKQTKSTKPIQKRKFSK
ncbi:MAG: pseudouridine synthase [Methylococcales bacterium]|nr:pseudouridine synthase [Methylococcales bacterium]